MSVVPEMCGDRGECFADASSSCADRGGGDGDGVNAGGGGGRGDGGGKDAEECGEDIALSCVDLELLSTCLVESSDSTGLDSADAEVDGALASSMLWMSSDCILSRSCVFWGRLVWSIQPSSRQAWCCVGVTSRKDGQSLLVRQQSEDLETIRIVSVGI